MENHLVRTPHTFFDGFPCLTPSLFKNLLRHYLPRVNTFNSFLNVKVGFQLYHPLPLSGAQAARSVFWCGLTGSKDPVAGTTCEFSKTFLFYNLPISKRKSKEKSNNRQKIQNLASTNTIISHILSIVHTR